MITAPSIFTASAENHAYFRSTIFFDFLSVRGDTPIFTISTFDLIFITDFSSPISLPLTQRCNATDMSDDLGYLIILACSIAISVNR